MSPFAILVPKFSCSLKALSSVPFSDWASRMKTNFNEKEVQVRGIHLQSVDVFGHGENKRIGFIKFKCDVIDKVNLFICLATQ